MSVSSGTVRTSELHDVHEAARLGPYLRDLLARRAYVWYVAKNELRNRQVNTVLGNFWHLLNPALAISVYYVIFGLLLEVDRGVDNFVLFLTVGLFIFQYTQKATIEGAKSVVGNLGLIKAVRFPRAMLPATATVTELLASISTFVVVYAVALITGEPIALRWLLLPAVVIMQFCFNLGAALIAARMASHFRDTIQILPFLFRLLLYASGVIFSVDAYVDSGSPIKLLFVLNPVFCFVTLGRWCIVGDEFRPVLVLSAVGWSIVIVVVGLLWFRAAEDRYARD
jgi:teichoic acid transport system permease protein